MTFLKTVNIDKALESQEVKSWRLWIRTIMIGGYSTKILSR